MSFLRELVEKTLPTVSEDWTDATLYSPYQDEQALIDQHADTLAVIVFLKMANLPFTLEQRPNAEFMSPSGEVPFLRLGQNTLVPEFSPIVELVGKKGIKLSGALTGSEQADIQAYCALIEEVLRNAERYLCWANDQCYKMVTKPRYASVYHWPLSLWLPALKRREKQRYLGQIGWASLPMHRVVQLCDKCFHTLSTRLAGQSYFIGDQPTELDALAFGHLYTILTTHMPDKSVVNMLKKYPNLIAFCKNIDREYFRANI